MPNKSIKKNNTPKRKYKFKRESNNLTCHDFDCNWPYCTETYCEDDKKADEKHKR